MSIHLHPLQRLSRIAAAALLAFIIAGSVTRQANAGEALVAVAANFADVLKEMTPLFEKMTGHKLTAVVGSTGKFYAQIVNGAPFHVLLAADQKRPQLLEEDGLTVAGSRFTYSVGRLTLWTANAEEFASASSASLKEVLTARNVRHIVIANPELAPYGAAARQVLQSLGLWDALSRKIVMTENIGQAFATVATGSAELGFVALSSVTSQANRFKGRSWEVPAGDYGPIAQDAVLLKPGENNEAAGAFMDFLKSDAALALIERYGYGVE